MTASVNSVEDVVNIALGMIGYERRIGDMFEGTRASKVALDLYGETRDETLRKKDWGFARREVALTLLKSAPVGGYGSAAWDPATNPQIPYAYEYGYPTDCIKLRYLTTTPAVMPVLDPQPTQFNVGNDTGYDPARRVILTQSAGAIGVYTGRITDMTTWEPLFVDTLTTTLAKRFMAALAAGQQLVELKKDLEGQEQMALVASEANEET